MSPFPPPMPQVISLADKPGERAIVMGGCEKQDLRARTFGIVPWIYRTRVDLSLKLNSLGAPIRKAHGSGFPIVSHFRLRDWISRCQDPCAGGLRNTTLVDTPTAVARLFLMTTFRILSSLDFPTCFPVAAPAFAFFFLLNW